MENCEWTDLGGDEPSRRAAWRRKVVSDPPESEVEAIRRSLRGGLPYGSPAWVEAMAQEIRRPLERRPPGRPRNLKN